MQGDSEVLSIANHECSPASAQLTDSCNMVFPVTLMPWNPGIWSVLPVSKKRITMGVKS